MKNSIFILGIVLLGSGIIYGQPVTNKNVLDKLYFKAGAEFYSLKRDDGGFKGDAGDISLIGSVIYDYEENVQLEFVYKYGFERSYQGNSRTYVSGEESINEGTSETLTDYDIDLKLNYFLNKDKTLNPIYLTGKLGFDVQNRKLYRYENHIGLNSTFSSFGNTVVSSYNRLLAGPGLGAGIFLAFGKINFQAESSADFRIAPFVDTGYKELGLNVSAALVYKF
jgi:hypothetical protein